MSKLKITIERKVEPVQTCKHEIGGVYMSGDKAYLVVQELGKGYRFMALNYSEQNNFCVIGNYKSLEEMDKANPNDIPVDAELIIHE